VEPEALVREFLEEGLGEGLGDLDTGQIYIAAFGKAAPAMARGAVAVLGERLVDGVVIAPAGQGEDLSASLKVHRGGHPIPNAEGVEGAQALRRLVSPLGEEDLLLCLISGGGSALMTLPPGGVALEEVQATTRALLRAGATIGELNGVRKHLDQLKGGRLARVAAPARVIALVLSDVVGDPIDVIASGPVAPDPTTFADSVEVFKRRDVWTELPAAVRRHFKRGVSGDEAESPEASDPCFARVETHILGNNRRAADAALAAARDRGYRTLLLTTTLEGEAREAGGFLAAMAREVRESGQPLVSPACLLAAGETTVNVRGSGRGGRNQEVALGAALALDGLEGVLVVGFGTDGIDGPTDAAGAFATGTTLDRARTCSLDAVQSLAENDSYTFFEALDDLIITGATGTNVMDLALVLVGEPKDKDSSHF
jgi:hydroxypyruvate reductase